MHPDPDLPDPKRMDRARAKAGLLVQKMIREERREREREERERLLALAKPDGGVIRDGDMGHGLAIERGIVEIDKDALVPLDPDSKRSPQRIQARAKRVWVPDRLLYRPNPAIEPHQHDAATRFYDDYLIGEEGARPNQTRGGIRLDPWNRLPYSEQRAMRRQSWRMAVEKVPLLGRSILSWCVLQTTNSPAVPPTVEAWAKAVPAGGWSTERAVGFLISVLDGLALHYGYSRSSGPSADRRRRERV